MSWSFNPFTGNLDLVGGGGTVVFEGEVETFAELPETVGNPAVGASYLVRSSTGVWLVNRRQAGIWIRRYDTGVRATDWEYGGDYPVTSVNGQTGNVSLTASSVGAAAATHASTHHTGGTDAIAPNNISAAWQQTISTLSLGNTTHSASAGRNQLILLTLTSGLGAGIILPDTGNAEGDRFAVRLDAAVSQGVTIRTSNYSLVVSGPNVGRTRSLIYTSGAWVEFPLTESHSHPTSDISGTWGPTFAVSRGSSLTNGPFTFDQSWTTANTTYTALQVNVTDAASAAGSLLQDWQVGGSSVASINKSGVGAFRTLSAAPTSGSALTLTGGTVTASAPLIDATQTWNDAAVTFRALRVNVTNTASASASLLADFQVGGTTQFSVRRDGAVNAGFYYRFTTLDAGLWVHSVGGQEVAFGSHPSHWFTITSTRLRLSGDISLGRSGSAGQAADTILVRDDAGMLAQRNGTNAQESRLYGTFTSSTNYQRMTVKSAKQTLSALSGASATTTGTFIPDGAVVVGVTTRVATLLTGAAGYTIGDGTDADRWGDITGTAVGTTSDNRDWTAGTVECFTAGGNITLTAKTSNFTAGAIEVCVFYLAGEAD